MRISAPVAGTYAGSPRAPRTPIVGFTKRGRAVFPIAGGANPGVMTQAPAPAQSQGGGGLVPFVRASYQYREKMRVDTIAALTAAQQAQAPINITPGGFLRGVWIEISGSGGALGTAVVGTPFDFPPAVIANIVLEDVNGQAIFGPVGGWELYAANKYGGYFAQGDPYLNPAFVGTYAAPYLVLWVPVEVRSDGLGSLANTDARAQYRLIYTVEAGLAGSPFLSTGTVTTGTALTITTWVDYWAQVEAKDMEGNPQEQVPPGLGTTQFTYHEIPAIATGAQTVKHNRVGNAIRGITYIVRDGTAAGAGAMANKRVNAYTDPIKIRLDNRYLLSESPNLRRAIMGRYYYLNGADGDPASAGTPVKGWRDTGVLAYPQSLDSTYTPSPGDLGDWLQTNEASFLQLEVTYTGTVASQTILTNDVSAR